MIRRGINKKNLKYWEDHFFKLTSQDKEISKLNAHRVCQEQEILKLKERIIKLEKQFNNLNKLK